MSSPHAHDLQRATLGRSLCPGASILFFGKLRLRGGTSVSRQVLREPQSMATKNVGDTVCTCFEVSGYKESELCWTDASLRCLWISLLTALWEGRDLCSLLELVKRF